MRILMLRGAGSSTGQSLLKGQEYDVSNDDGLMLVRLGKARRVEATPAGVVETREPVAQHREPVVRNRGTRGR